jgi:hypothetical protein
MLSEAKHLRAHRDRRFTSLSMTTKDYTLTVMLSTETAKNRALPLSQIRDRVVLSQMNPTTKCY